MKLEQYLEKYKISRGDFAKKIGVSTPTIYYYISGRIPRQKTIEKIYQETKGKVTADDFMNYSKK